LFLRPTLLRFENTNYALHVQCYHYLNDQKLEHKDEREKTCFFSKWQIIGIGSRPLNSNYQGEHYEVYYRLSSTFSHKSFSFDFFLP